MTNLVWFLTGFIIGMLALLLIIISYETHASIKLVRNDVVGMSEDGRIILKEAEPKIKSIKLPKKKGKNE